jgi:hypothetical protein
MARSLQSQKTHDEMVARVVSLLQHNNANSVKADLKGFVQPEKITWSATREGHIPDITAYDGRSLIYEVETDDSINLEHTGSQWVLFAAHARNHNHLFVVVVPRGSNTKASQRLTELGITANILEI